MRLFLTVVLICCIASGLSAQALQAGPRGSVQFSADSVNNFLRSASGSFAGADDSLSIIVNEAVSAVDSIRQSFGAKTSALSNLTTHLEHKLDSLSTLGKKSAGIQSKLDSVKSRLESIQRNLGSKIDSCQSAAIGKLSQMRLPPELEAQRRKAVELMRSNMHTVTSKLNVAGVKAPDINLGTPQSVAGNLNLPQTNIPNANIPVINSPGLSTGIGSVSDVSEAAVQEKVEQKVSELIDKESIDRQLEAMPVPTDFSEDALKEQLASQVHAQAVNHFAGHEREIEAAMHQLSKYKKEYENVVNTAQILKLRKNDMKGKPFLDRVRPGVMMQFSNRNGEWSLDLNVYAGYRITDKLTVGPGWNQRIAYTVDIRRFNPKAAVYGPRVFAEFEAWKGFCPRIEGEVMKTHKDFSKLLQPADPNYNNWVWGAFVGLKKAYNISGRLRGSACVMTRLFNHEGQSPYPSPLSVRAGFEFSLSRLKKPKDETSEQQN